MCSSSSSFTYDGIPLLRRVSFRRHQIYRLQVSTSVVIRFVVAVIRFVVVVPELWMLINKRGESVENKIKKLDVELCKYREQIQKTRSGLVQQALKARAMRLLKQKKMYEGQRDMLYNQTFNLDQLLSTPVDMARSYMRARLPWRSLSVNNSEFWSPSSAGTQLLKEGTPFSYNAGNLSSSKFSNRKFAYQHVFLMALSELWLSQILACVFIRCCIWPSRTLSRNKLNGTIPVSLTGLPNLINLLFDSNNLNGQIPQTLFQIPKYNFTGNNLNCGVGQPHPCVSEVARSGIDIKDTNVTCSWMLQWCCSEHQHQNHNEFKKFYKVLIYICCQDLLTDHHHSEREKGSTTVFKQ
ncbi:hypothetical protein IGI04_012925 [Brassica rapa subsp. trilocularis]|uniref:Uncharacterized protein n=1 Tax=Brassica rapa subsp. trilocularis TaxID=1813537 RepID=A0ABQ7N9G2_BRACM|nr:hypothetical protein IGI04_012925 [Brassica rapa subsp. trilocularis]